MTRSAAVGRVAACLAAAGLAAPLAAPLGAVAQAAPSAVALADPGAPVAARIRDVQGAGHVSPLNGRDVTGVAGVATAVTDSGFWMQDPAPGGGGAASDGIFVFTRTRPQVRPGDAVRVTGRVSEFRPGGPGSSALSRTEIDATETVVSSHDQPLPAPVVLGGPGGRKAPASFPGAQRDAEADRTFDTRSDPLAFYSSLEGMRVRIVNAVAIGPTRDGALPVLPAGGAGAQDRTRRGGSLARPGGLPDPARIVLADALAPLPSADVGDRLPGPVDGVLDYTAAGFVLLPTATPARTDGGLKPQAAPAAGADQLSVGTLNLEGLSPDTPSDRVTALADDLVEGLGSPDLVTVTGVEDNSGAADDGTVAADQTVSELITAVSAAGGPAYEWRSVARTTTPTAATAAPTGGSASCSAPTAGWRSPTGRPARPTWARRVCRTSPPRRPTSSRTDGAARASPSAPAASRRPTPPGTSRANRSRAS